MLCIGLGLFASKGAYAQVLANFSSNITSGCSPILVQFSDQSTGNPTSWTWDLGNGTISTLQNPSTTYITPGSYTVILTVSDGTTTNTKTVTNYITAVPTPIVNFVANDSGFLCPPATIQFTDLSSMGIGGTATYLWDFGDGNTSNQANPAHTYNNMANYSVTLNVTNSAGCSKLLTKTNYIQLIPTSVAGFSASATSACTAPFTTTFTSTSTGATSYFWDFGDGGTSTSANPTHTYNTTGSYTVTLVTSNPGDCKDTLAIPAYIYVGGVNASFTKSVASTCIGSNVTFTNTSLPLGTTTWNFGDGNTSTAQNPTHAYTSAGTYTVKLVVTNGSCSDSTTQTIVVNNPPTSSFSATQTTGCSVPFTTQFNNTATGATSYLWNFGDGNTSTSANPSHTYTSFGTYAVTLTAFGPNGCQAVQTMPAYVNLSQATMLVSATPSTGCAPVTVNFTSSATTTIPVSSYVWNFGDGNTATGTSTMTHTYANPGTYNATVTFTTGAGCSFTSSAATVNAGTAPVAGFTFTPASPCPNQNVTFTNTTVGPPGTTYQWYFGDGGSSTQANPVYAYPVSNTYTIMLIANSNGCKDTFQMPIVVNPPMAQFAVTYSCSNRKQISFTNTSTGGTQFHWDFGDGNTSTQQNPGPHTYGAFGSYNVILSVTHGPSGCISTQTIPVEVYNLDAQFATSDSVLCRGESTTFTAVPSSKITEYQWYFGYGLPVVYTGSNANTVSHSYANSGVYTVRLVVKDARGCTDTLIKTGHITVTSPTVAFSGTPLSGCAPLTVNFTDASTSSAAIVGRIWRFGDGTSDVGNLPTVSKIYGPGTFSVRLKITDANGCSDSLNKPNYVTSVKPVAAFVSPDTNKCPGQTVTFVNGSTGTSLAYNWDFGDGNSSTVANPSHVYNATGNYTVRLIVTDAGACKDTLIRNAYIKVNTVNLGFTASDTFASCPPLTVNFTNTSLNAGNFTWSFGNGNTSTLTSPSTIFTLPGVYNVKLKGTNSAGCVDSVFKTITILGPMGTLSYSPINGCTPLTVNFSSTNTNTAQLIWDMNNGVTQTTTGSSTSYTYTTPGMYVPKLLLSDGVSCIVPIQGPDTIKADYINADFTYSAASICQEGTIQFFDTTLFAVNPVATRSWTFGDGGVSSLHNPTHYYTSPGSYTVTLVIGTTQGCKDTIVKSITVLPAPVIAVSPTQDLCQGQTTSAQLLATGAQTYSWTPSATLSCANCDNPVATPTGTTTYTVVGTAANGCMDTAAVTVNVNALPTVSAGADQSICSGAFAQLQAAGAATYSWSPALGLSCTSCPNPGASPAVTTIYTVTGVDTNGCVATDQVEVSVSPLPTVSGGPNQTICIGNSAQLQATGAASYTWTPATGLSCTNCPNPVANPTTTTTYTVVGLGGSANNCANTSQVTVTVVPLPTINAGNNVAFCAGSSAQLQATGATSYSWTPANGLSCTTCPNPIANPTVTTLYTVTGTDANGCSNSGAVTVTNNPLPAISAGSDQSICIGGSVQLQATGGVTYSWSPSAGLSCTSCANPTASPAVTTTYTVTGIDANGCVNTSQVIVTVNPLPTIDAGATQIICNGTSAQLQASGASSYVWSPATDLSCSTCPNPLASPSTTTTYNVTGTDNNGCVSTGQVTVTVNPLPVVSPGNNQNICIGTSAQLSGTGAATYTWSPANDLSCTTCANPVATPSTTTTYTLTGTDVNGCSDTAQVTVTVNQLPAISAGADQSICVGSTASLTATGGATYLWSPATDLSCVTCSNPAATPATSTVYTVTGTDLNGCVNTDQLVVTVNPLPVVDAGQDQTVCNGTTAQQLATGASTYTWTPATGLSCTTCDNPAAAPNTTTTYTVTGTDINGCVDTNQVTIIVNPLPTISAGASQAYCIGGSAQLQASGGVSYVWSPATDLSCTTCPDPVANPIATTTYTVTGTDANGCSDTSSVTITVNPLPVIDAGADQNICAGAFAQLQATGAVSYVWTPSTGLSCTTCPNPSSSPAATTLYTVTGTDANGCVGTDQIEVSVSQLPTVSAGPNQTICAGSSVQLQATGASSFSWTPATSLSCTGCANPTATPSVTTTYTVVGMGGSTNNCSNTSQVTITVVPVPTVSAGANASFCEGDSVQLQATGANAYSWTPAVGLSCNNCADPFASPAMSTIYTVTGTDANGCTASSQVTVTNNPLPVLVKTSDTTICEGQTAQLSVSGANTYNWSPSTGLSCTTCANPVASPNATTTYTVTGTTAAGCVDSAVVTVTVNPNPVVTVTASNLVLCAGDSSQLQATGSATYSWSPASGLSCTSCANPMATPAVTTTYTVIGMNPTGCIDTAQVTIVVNQLPAVSAGNDQSICFGSLAQLQATGAASYVWTPSTDLSCSTCPNPVANVDTTTTFTVTGTSAAGCTSSSQVTITVNSLPVITVSNDDTTCAGVAVPLQVSGAQTYAWSPAADLSCVSCASPTATPVATTMYTVIGADANGCLDTAQVNITVNQLPIVSAGADQGICKLNAAQLQATGAVTYVWTPGNSLSCTTCDNPVATPTATTTYTVTGTDANGCSNSDNVIVSLHAQPDIDAGADKVLCSGQSIQLNATGGQSYVWSPATDLSCVTCADPFASPTSDITYTVVGTDVNGCSDSDKITITVVEMLPFTVGPGDTICVGESTQLFASGGDTYQWIPSTGLDNPTVPNPIATPNATTTYMVIAQQGVCFADTSEITVVVNPLPVVDAGPDRTIIAGNSTELYANATNAAHYVWSPAEFVSCADCQTAIASPQRTTSYTVKVTSEFGCEAKDEVTVIVNCDNAQLFIANTFTPNADGHNDRFFPQGKGISTIARLRIFNRWGELVYDVQNIPPNAELYGWDGTYKNEPLKPDVFVYILDATCATGEPLQIKGDISLIR